MGEKSGERIARQKEKLASPRPDQLLSAEVAEERERPGLAVLLAHEQQGQVGREQQQARRQALLRRASQQEPPSCSGLTKRSRFRSIDSRGQK